MPYSRTVVNCALVYLTVLSMIITYTIFLFLSEVVTFVTSIDEYC